MALPALCRSSSLSPPPVFKHAIAANSCCCLMLFQPVGLCCGSPTLFPALHSLLKPLRALKLVAMCIGCLLPPQRGPPCQHQPWRVFEPSPPPFWGGS